MGTSVVYVLVGSGGAGLLSFAHTKSCVLFKKIEWTPLITGPMFAKQPGIFFKEVIIMAWILKRPEYCYFEPAWGPSQYKDVVLSV